jgi:hypothetical protein
VCGEAPVEGGAPGRVSVLCADCGTFHHRECFEYSGQCAVYGCGGLRCSTSGRGGRDVQVLVIGHPSAERLERMILDLTTPAESAATRLQLAGLALLLLAGCGVSAALGPCVIALIAGYTLGASTDCYYVADGRTRRIFYHQKILGIRRLTTALGFGALSQVQLRVRTEWMSATERRLSHWRHALWLAAADAQGNEIALSDEVCTDATEWWVEARRLLERGEQLSRLTGQPFGMAPRRFDVLADGPRAAMIAVALVMLAAYLWLPTGSSAFVMIAIAGAAAEMMMLMFAASRSGWDLFVHATPDLAQALDVLGRETVQRLLRTGARRPVLPP